MPLLFETQSGRLIARSTADGIELDFPIKPLPEVDVPDALVAALGVERVPQAFADQRRYLVELPNGNLLHEFWPDFRLLGKLDRGVVVTARSDGDPHDFVSRYFAVPFGVPEDPVTGSAHCSLAPYWRDRLGKDSFFAFQASPRGGELRVRIEGQRVFLTGNTVTVLRGELTV